MISKLKEIDNLYAEGITNLYKEASDKCHNLKDSKVMSLFFFCLGWNKQEYNKEFLKSVISGIEEIEAGRI
jgi:hypothetical protein